MHGGGIGVETDDKWVLGFRFWAPAARGRAQNFEQQGGKPCPKTDQPPKLSPRTPPMPPPPAVRVVLYCAASKLSSPSPGTGCTKFEAPGEGLDFDGQL